jgi:L-lysine 6-transaminase
MLILGCGGNTVRFRPALNVPLEDIEKGMDISRKAAKAVFKK